MLTQVLYENAKPKVSHAKVLNLVGKLPEIMFEWQYMESTLKQHSYNFKDKKLTDFSKVANDMAEDERQL